MTEELEAIELQKSDEVTKKLEERHILDDEIKMVINNAESLGEKLYLQDSDIYLARLRLGNATFYVEYSAAGEKCYTVHTAYSHRTELKE